MLKLELLKNINVLLVIDKSMYTFYSQLSLYMNNIIICHNEIDAYNKSEANNVNVIFIDSSISELNSYNLCSRIRKINKHVSIILMSEDSEINKILKIIPLKITCYLLKPITSMVLVETLHLILNDLKENEILFKKKYFSNFSYDYTLNQLIDLNKNVEISLTKSEIILLELFLDNMNRVVSCVMIYKSFKEIKSQQAIKNMIYRLRLKLKNDDVIKNLHGMGYILKSNDSIYPKLCNSKIKIKPKVP